MPEADPSAEPPRDIWRDIAWGISRGLALACLPLLLTLLPGRLPVDPARPRLLGRTDATLAILALGFILGAIAGICRPMGRSFPGSLFLGCALTEASLFLLRQFGPHRTDQPPLAPFGPGLLFGVLLGLAFYLAELHRRTERNSLSG